MKIRLNPKELSKFLEVLNMIPHSRYLLSDNFFRIDVNTAKMHEMVTASFITHDASIRMNLPSVKIIDEKDEQLIFPIAATRSFIKGLKNEVELEQISLQQSCIRAYNGVKLATLLYIPYIPSLDYLPEWKFEPAVTVTLGSEFSMNLKRVAICTADESSRPVLTCVNMKTVENEIELVAADGFHMCIARQQADDQQDIEVLIPGNIAKLVAKYANGKVAVSHNEAKTKIKIKCQDLEIISNTGSGTFPNYIQLVPHENTIWQFSCSGPYLQSYLERTGHKMIRFMDSSDEDILLFSSENDDLASAKIPANVNGKGKICIDAKLLKDILKFTSYPLFECTTPSSPTKITEGDGNLIYVLMPIFVQWDDSDIEGIKKELDYIEEIKCEDIKS